MPRLIGPDFIRDGQTKGSGRRTDLLIRDIAGAYAIGESSSGRDCFSKRTPSRFAVRTPIEDFDDTQKLGVGIAIWFGCDDA